MHLDLTVMRGECFGLLGPNGAGKTTSIEILKGLLHADAGELSVLGQQWSRDAAALRPRLGIQLPDTQLADKLTVSETLRLFRSFYPDGPTVEALMQPVIRVLPLTALIDTLRAVTNEGQSLAGLAPEMAVLAAWGSVSFGLSLRLFRWQ